MAPNVRLQWPRDLSEITTSLSAFCSQFVFVRTDNHIFFDFSPLWLILGKFVNRVAAVFLCYIDVFPRLFLGPGLTLGPG